MKKEKQSTITVIKKPLRLSDAEKEAVLSGNVKRLLKLT